METEMSHVTMDMGFLLERSAIHDWCEPTRNPRRRRSGRDGVRVEDRVAVALLREEPLAVLREVLVDGVARDERVEVGREARLLGAQRATEALRLLLARAERARHLDGDRRLGEVDREVRHLRHD